VKLNRLLAPVCLLTGLMCPISAWAQVAVLHATPCGPQNFPGSACTIPATSPGSLLVVGWQVGGGVNTSTVISGVSDNVGNIYVEAGAARSIDTAAGSVADIWYSVNAIAGTTAVAIATGSNVTNGAAVIWEFTGPGAAVSLDGTAVLNSQAASSSPQGAPLTASSANEVIVSLASVTGNITGVVSGNPFIADSALNGNGWAHLITPAAGLYSARWAQSSSGTYSSSTASFKSALSAISPCDLNQDGVVNMTDVQLSVNMALGLAPCTANVGGAGVCNIAVVQRVVNAALGASCLTGGGAVPHYVSLTWNASTSQNVAGYNVYRGTVSGGPYTKVNPSLVTGTVYTDSTVLAGQTYYYVCTTVDTNNNESAYSSPSSTIIPIP
jgi:hypothetical protein